MSSADSNRPAKRSRALGPFRTAVLRGLAVVAPPLLTIVILLWIVRTVNYYVLEPVTLQVRNVVAWSLTEAFDELPNAQPGPAPDVFTSNGQLYERLPNDQFVPLAVYSEVAKSPGPEGLPDTPQDVYRRYVELKYLQSWIVIPIFVVVFVALMYLLGSIFAAGLGRVFVGLIERGVDRLPFVRAVYNSTKQVTNYVFSERELEFTRVVAVEYPCRGVWSLAFVTNESLADVQKVSGVPMLTILLPTSPVPVSGYTMLIPKSDVLDMDMTVEQAVEYIVSCGVVLPPNQFEHHVEEELEQDSRDSPAVG